VRKESKINGGAEFIDLHDLFPTATCRISAGLSKAIIFSLKTANGLLHLQDLTVERLRSLLNGFVEKSGRKAGVNSIIITESSKGSLKLDFMVSSIDCKEGKVMIKILLPVTGFPSDLRSFLQEIINELGLEGVLVDHDGLVTAVFLKGENRPVELIGFENGLRRKKSNGRGAKSFWIVKEAKRHEEHEEKEEDKKQLRLF
jgi:hypothetical protein